MNISRSILVNGHGLEQDVVVIIVQIFGEVDDLVNFRLHFECIWVHRLADLAFKTLPVE